MESQNSVPCKNDEPIILANSGHPITRKDIDADALKILYRLDRLGFIACLCGGAVRDLMLGKKPKDFDIVTDARPGQIKKRFANVYVIGRRFRLAHVHFEGGKIIEVATFRKDLKAVKERAFAAEMDPQALPEAPAGVLARSLLNTRASTAEADPQAKPGALTRDVKTRLSTAEVDPQARPGAPAAAPAAEAAPDPKDIYGTPREDAFRRDITINALLYDFATDSIIDYVGGLEDLARRKVRIIGDPEERLAEDPVRVWRAIRHAARLGFDIEETTERAIRSHGHLLAACPGSRLYEEFNKDLAYETRPVIEALWKRGILRHILGRVGEDYEADAGLFHRLETFLDIIDRTSSAAFHLSLEEMYALFFWPWMEPLFADTAEDMTKILADAFVNARTEMIVPKNLRANVIQIMIIVGAMRRALCTGHMRWALKRRAHYAQASKMCFMIEKGRPAEGEESFESLLRTAYPSAWRPRKRRGG
jgi:poly(A) polymerase